MQGSLTPVILYSFNKNRWTHKRKEIHKRCWIEGFVAISPCFDLVPPLSRVSKKALKLKTLLWMVLTTGRHGKGIDQRIWCGDGERQSNKNLGYLYIGNNKFSLDSKDSKNLVYLIFLKYKEEVPCLLMYRSNSDDLDFNQKMMLAYVRSIDWNSWNSNIVRRNRRNSCL